MEVDEDVVGIGVDLIRSHGLQPDEYNDVEHKDASFNQLCRGINNGVLLNVGQEVHLVLFVLVYWNNVVKALLPIVDQDACDENHIDQDGNSFNE